MFIIQMWISMSLVPEDSEDFKYEESVFVKEKIVGKLKMDKENQAIAKSEREFCSYVNCSHMPCPFKKKKKKYLNFIFEGIMLKLIYINVNYVVKVFVQKNVYIITKGKNTYLKNVE